MRKYTISQMIVYEACENNCLQARRGQSIKSEVLLIKDDFVLVALKGHTQGLLAYLPAKTVSQN